MHRYKLTLEYVGHGYCGWQKQKDSLSLQTAIERAIYNFSKENDINLVAAGRTDSGVNAYGQVAHINLSQHYPEQRLMHSINYFLKPHTIAVIDCIAVPETFHARFSAKSRHYVYKIINRKAPNIINNKLQYWIRPPLDTNKMQKAANFLLGKHDFSSFRASECQSNSPIKTLDKIDIIQNGEYIEIYVSALSFLHHMVRNIVGSLILVGKNKWQPEKMIDILNAKSRDAAGPTAPAHGLYFLKVDY